MPSILVGKDPTEEGHIEMPCSAIGGYNFDAMKRWLITERHCRPSVIEVTGNRAREFRDLAGSQRYGKRDEFFVHHGFSAKVFVGNMLRDSNGSGRGQRGQQRFSCQAVGVSCVIGQKPRQ